MTDLLEDKTSIFYVFKCFHNEIKMQFSTPLCILWINNTLEYMKSSFDTYCSTHAIIHQSSCAYTPQQNDVAGRKNRHLLDVARSLMFQMDVPKIF